MVCSALGKLQIIKLWIDAFDKCIFALKSDSYEEVFKERHHVHGVDWFSIPPVFFG